MSTSLKLSATAPGSCVFVQRALTADTIVTDPVKQQISTDHFMHSSSVHIFDAWLHLQYQGEDAVLQL